MEELLWQINPKRPDYKVFMLKYADAFYVAKTLREYFKEEDKNNRNSRFDIFGDFSDSGRDDPPRGFRNLVR